MNPTTAQALEYLRSLPKYTLSQDERLKLGRSLEAPVSTDTVAPPLQP
jgi:hypothetical protein